MASNYEAITKHNERQLGLDTASRKTQICMYSDSTHFIFEILQNADDYGASEIFFKLSKNELLIEHDGEAFIEKNVKAITYFGESTSRDDLVKTGRFGVGFKSVFAFTATPTVISGDEHFQIYGLYRVRKHPYPDDFSPSRTRITLPFNHASEKPDYVEDLMSKEEAYSKISERLTGLNMNALLFTRNILNIRWEIDGRSGHYLREDDIDNNARRTTIKDGHQLKKYLVFSRVPWWENKEYKAVEVAFAIDEKDQLSPVDDFLYVLFPTTQETHLQFILNGPYRTNPSRETISEEDNFNVHLMKETCALMKDVLPQLRGMSLLTTQFLSVLPNDNDKLRDFYKPIQNRLIEAFQNENLTPMKGGGHAAATGIYQGSANLSNLINDDDLATILGEGYIPPIWVANPPQRNQREDNFLSMLNISKWTIEDLVSVLSEQSIPTTKWLSKKSDEWHQRLYALLGDFLSNAPSYPYYVAENRKNKLAGLPIVRLNNGNYNVGSKCFFPSDGEESDEVLPRIPEAIYSSGKNKTQQETARKFLEKIGVREVGEAEQVEAILKQRYSPEAVKRNEFKPAIKDIERFSALVEKEQTNAELFADYYILERADGKWCKPDQVYLDSPFIDTGLSAYYEALGEETQCFALAKIYEDYGMTNKKIADFAEAVGAQTGLEIAETTCKNNPQWDCLQRVPGKRHSSPINHDYIIPKLQALLQEPTIRLSKLVWRRMCSLPSEPNYLQAEYRKNAASGSCCASSQLVHHLRNAAWVPQTNGGFVRPSAASRELLPEGFPFDAGQKWLEAIEFGATAQKQSEEYGVQNHHAKRMGFESAEEAAKAREIAELCRQTGTPLDDLIAQFKPDVRNEMPAFPERASSNPEDRKEKLAEQLGDASNKEYEQRGRNVRTTRGTVDPVLWLRNLYKNEDAQMICQVCKEEMPFRKRDGEYYFEAVEALSKEHFTKEQEAQFLALCPLCAAMYKEFVKQDEGAMANLKNVLMNSNDFEVPLRLGELDTSIRFVETHYHDIKTIIKEMG